MHHSTTVVALSALLIFAIAGCQNHQAQVDVLQKEYDQLGQQYRQDCSTELLNVPPKLSPKCADENKKVGDAWNRLQAERAKK
ncbi:MAG TPA: hypothetical protein VFB43_10825 [Terracidiphilus sp.]|nr:hypothetical protein [Terracidiphilus sp.]